MKNLFVCATGYQLFNICNIIKNKYSFDENYLVVIGTTKHAREDVYILAQKLVDEFKEVILLVVPFSNSNSKNCIIRSIQCFFRYIKVSFYKIKDIQFNRVFYTGGKGSYAVLFLYKYIGDKNVKLFFIDDGMGSYIDILKEDKKEGNYIYRLFYKMLKWKYKCCILDMVEGSFLYEPSYIISNPRNIPLIPIEKINVSSDYAIELYKKFSKIDDMSSKCDLDLKNKWIFFDMPSYAKTDLNKDKEIIENIRSNINKELLIKSHPASLNNDSYGCKKLEVQDNFEIYNLINSMQDTTLVSVISTAAFIPKLIFNEEPTIILLYKLFEDWNNEEFDYLVKNIKISYAKDKFYVPKTMDELINICKDIGQDN